MGDAQTTSITRETPVKTNIGTAVAIVAATAFAVGTTVGTYMSLKSDIAVVKASVEPLIECKPKIDQLWWEHHQSTASNTPARRNQP